MKLSFIGMSNIGKTYWSKKLEMAGFLRFGCDDLIEKKLVKILNKSGFSSIADMAKWMGQPYHAGYKKNSKIYLQCEEEVIREIIEDLKTVGHGINVVVDTTGSLIYLEKKLLDELKFHTKFVYFGLNSEIKEKMFENYLENPKPVYWGNSFKFMRGMSNIDALKFSYGRLLDFRIESYNRLADITIDYGLSRDHNFSEGDLVRVVREYDQIPFHPR